MNRLPRPAGRESQAEMLMGEIGFEKLVLIMVVVLLLFGAKRLPEIGASLGKGIREFKRSLADTSGAVSGEPDSQERRSPRQDASAAAPRSSEANGPKRLSE
jgi:sec-independent protein translocase protein TatA